jgi:hypothetical protein
VATFLLPAGAAAALGVGIPPSSMLNITQPFSTARNVRRYLAMSASLPGFVLPVESRKLNNRILSR